MPTSSASQHVPTSSASQHVPIHNTTQGNKSISTEVREIAVKEEQLPNDYVTLQLDGIEVTWGDEDLFEWFALSMVC